MFISIIAIPIIIFFIIYFIITEIIYFKKINKNAISKIFVINLPRRTDKLSFFSTYYNLNMPFEIFNAIDGNKLNLNKLIKNNIVIDINFNDIKRKSHYELSSLGAIGCYLSHYLLWLKINNINGENFLIFEDDTIFNNICLNQINYRLKNLPNDWDIYILSNHNSCYKKNKTKHNLYKVDRFFLMNAYIINKKAINKIIKTNTIFPINQQIDSYLSELAMDYNLNIYVNTNYDYYSQSIDLTTDIQLKFEKDLNFNRCKIYKYS